MAPPRMVIRHYGPSELEAPELMTITKIDDIKQYLNQKGAARLGNELPAIKRQLTMVIRMNAIYE